MFVSWFSLFINHYIVVKNRRPVIFKPSSTVETSNQILPHPFRKLRARTVHSIKLVATIPGIGLAFVFWYFTFNTDLMGGFWSRIALSVGVLSMYAYFTQPNDMLKNVKDINVKLVTLGVFSGLGLYVLFYVGYNVFKPFLQQGAMNVYLLTDEALAWYIAVILVFTSFCEEFFWRGFVQRNLMNALGRWNGFISSTAFYTLIHVFTSNIPLIIAAMIAGLWWGLLYILTRSIWLTITSHIVWTELILLFLPLR